jgi:hypothetical protein
MWGDLVAPVWVPSPCGLFGRGSLPYNRGILPVDSAVSAVSVRFSEAPERVSAGEQRAARPLLGGRLDFLLLGPGATLIVSAALGALWYGGHSSAATSLAANLVLLCLGPHYAATYRRAYGSAEIIRDHPFVTLVAPILLIAGGVAAAYAPRGFGSFYFLAYVAWSGFHYSRQSLGIAMIYPLRQRAPLSAREKRLLGLPLYASWILSLLGLTRAGVAARNAAYQVVTAQLSSVHVPAWLLLVLLAPLAATFGAVALVAAERRRGGAPLPRACLAVIATQVIWFAIGLFHPYFNVVLVPVFHSVQYLALTGWHFTRAPRPASLLPFAGYLVTVLLLGLVINPGLVILLVPNGVSAHALTVGAAVISAINLHHFLLDGRIWRMREARVAQTFAA